MKQIIHNIKMLQKKLFSEYKMIAVLGDMRELEHPKQAHEMLALELFDYAAIFTVGPNMYEYLIPELKKSGFQGDILSSLSSRDIGQKLKDFLDSSFQKYLVLFK